MAQVTLEALAQEITARAKAQDRVIVALAGPPGAGKSTVSAQLADLLGAGAAVLPMDGFHLENDRLHAMGLFARKGAPETFDASGFAKLLGRVRSEREVSFPTFDRSADRTLPDTGRIAAGTRIVLVEGNYLLLNQSPWAEMAPLFDMTVALKVARDVLEARLIARWLEHGLPAPEARARALGNDMRNVDVVQTQSRPAEFTLAL